MLSEFNHKPNCVLKLLLRNLLSPTHNSSGVKTCTDSTRFVILLFLFQSHILLKIIFEVAEITA